MVWWHKHILLIRTECKFSLGRCFVECKISVILSKDCGKDVADRANDKRTSCCNLSIPYLTPGEKFLWTNGNPQENCLHTLDDRYQCLHSKPLMCVFVLFWNVAVWLCHTKIAWVIYADVPRRHYNFIPSLLWWSCLYHF